MKYILAMTIPALFVCAMPAPAQTAVDRLKDAASDIKHAFKDAAGTVEQKTRQAWRETKGYLSNDAGSYRPAAAEELGDLGATLADLKHQAVTAAFPPYFSARLDALVLQQSSCSRQLAALTPEDIRDPQSLRRADFDEAFSWLETYVDLAQREAHEMPVIRQ